LNTQNNNIDNADWIFGITESDNFSYTAAGYSGADAIYKPSLVKVDENLNSINSTEYTSFSEGTNPFVVSGFSTFNDIRCINNDYTIAVGHANLDINGTNKQKPIIAKTNYALTSLNGKTFFTSDNIEYRFWCVKEYINDDGDIYYFVAGLKKESSTPVWFVAIIDENLALVSNTNMVVQNNSADIVGEIRGICLSYPNGSLPNGKPVIAGETPDRVLLAGNCIENGKENAMLIAVDFNKWFTNQNKSIDILSSKEIDSDPNGINSYSSTFFDRVTFPIVNWPCSTLTTPASNFNDIARSIEQDKNGNYIMSVFAHFVILNETQVCSNEVPNDFDEMRSADLVLHSYRWDNGGLIETAKNHLGHVSGYDFEGRAKFDHDGKIYVLSSNGDFGISQIRANQSPPFTSSSDYNSNYILFKAELINNGGWQINRLWHKIIRGGTGPTTDQSGSVCGFDFVVTHNNEIVGGGDNKIQTDNYDIIKVGRDCQVNQSKWDILPNMPDGITFSVKQALGNPASGTLTWGADHYVKAIIKIESGFTLQVPYYWPGNGGNTIEFADPHQVFELADQNNLDFSIVVEPNGKLILKNQAKLTSSSGSCESSNWGGIQLLSAPTAGPTANARLELEDAIIENAKIGVQLYYGGIAQCKNTYTFAVNGDFVIENFKNCRKSVEFLQNTKDIPNPSYFNNINFISSQAINDMDGKGINGFVSLWDVQGVTFRGCRFLNTYNGELKTGNGITSFNASYNVMPGNEISINHSGCTQPVGRNNRFYGLTNGIVIGNESSLSKNRRVKIANCDFINNGKGILQETTNNTFIYSNYYEWDAIAPSMHATNATNPYFLYSNFSDDIKVIQNNINLTLPMAQPFYGMGVFNTNVDILSNLSKIQKNTITNNTTAPPLPGSCNITGHIFNGDNSNLLIMCNTYTDLYQDWLCQASSIMSAQTLTVGPIDFDLNNSFTTCYNSPFKNKIINNSNNFDYFNLPPSINPNLCSKNVDPKTANDILSCSAIPICDIYTELGDFKENLPEELMVGKHPDKNASSSIAKIENTADFSLLYNQLQMEQRLFKATNDELAQMYQLAIGTDFSAAQARNYLRFFYGYVFNNPEAKQESQLAQKSNQLKKVAPNKVHYYPNPNNGILLTIKLNKEIDQDVDLHLIDNTGKLISKYVLNKDILQSEITLPNLASGFYFIHCSQYPWLNSKIQIIH